MKSMPNVKDFLNQRIKGKDEQYVSFFSITDELLKKGFEGIID
jgi:hypothetical protein